jgi:hypothetical protein
MGATDNMVVDYGANPGALTQNVAATCTAGKCTAPLTIDPGTLTYFRIRWIRSGSTVRTGSVRPLVVN